MKSNCKRTVLQMGQLKLTSVCTHAAIFLQKSYLTGRLQKLTSICKPCVLFLTIRRNYAVFVFTLDCNNHAYCYNAEDDCSDSRLAEVNLLSEASFLVFLLVVA